jgi:hypothetical protein
VLSVVGALGLNVVLPAVAASQLDRVCATTLRPNFVEKIAAREISELLWNQKHVTALRVKVRSRYNFSLLLFF